MSNWPRGRSRPIIAMDATRLGGVLLLLISIAVRGQQTRTSAATISGAYVAPAGAARSAASGAAPGHTPVYRIKLRVHNGQTTLPPVELRKSLEELNFIWWSQAG